MAPSGDNCILERSLASITGLSPFHEFITKTSAVTNRKCLSKSSAANPKFLEGIGMCWNKFVWKHCKIPICLLNSWVSFNKSRFWQVRQSKDCNSWMKLTLYSSHKISQTTFSGGNTPEGTLFPAKQLAPLNHSAFPPQGTCWILAKLYSRLLVNGALPWFPPSPVWCCQLTEMCAKTDLTGQEMTCLPHAWTKHHELRATTQYVSLQ